MSGYPLVKFEGAGGGGLHKIDFLVVFVIWDRYLSDAFGPVKKYLNPSRSYNRLESALQCNCITRNFQSN